MSRRLVPWSIGAAVCGLFAFVAVALGATPSGPSSNTIEQAPRKFIVVYRDAPLASYKGELRGLPAPSRLQRRTPTSAAQSGARMDVNSGTAKAYVRHLQGQQSQSESRIVARIGHRLDVERRMTHALNGMVALMTDAEAATVRALPEVRLVEEYREYELDTDVGPTLIGAPQLWNAPSNPVKGEGIVFGIIDSGINFGSPSFAATDESGYTHVNPRGKGNYLGTCAADGVDKGRCNSKLIGGYDFVCQAPGEACANPAYREEPGFGDTSGHGSHTASTAAGNVRTVQFRGRPVKISGVAPRANIVAYDVCYTNTATDRGLCPNVSSVAAVDQAIIDGVDVINFSIGGGSQPWSDAVSLAFLSATDAGIYVATSAGNSGPAANSMGHLEPWTGSTAAAQHGRGDYGFLLQVTGPGPVDPALRIVQLIEGSSAAAFVQALPNSTPLRVSDRIDSTDDGCAAFPADAFRGAIAMVRRGGCSFAIKGTHAAAAGAVAIVIANNRVGRLSPSAAGVPIPTFATSQDEANAVRDFARSHGNAATAGIGYPPVPIPNLHDVLGDFSSRGPAGTFDLVKPDLTAPGVSVLAAYAGTTISGFEDLVAVINGTSMASPHHAGAAGLLRQARPSWTVPEIKSALLMTATQEVYKEDATTPGTPFDRGGGRVQVDQALQAGLVLNETTANFLKADPAQRGDASTLNLPSLGKADCVERCVFTRVFRSTQPVRQAWTVRLKGMDGTVSPALFVIRPGQTKAVKITINATSLPADGSWNFGNVVLTPQSVGSVKQPILRLPVAVSVPPPRIALPPRISLSVPAGSNSVAKLRIGSVGGARLQFHLDNAGNGSSTLHDAAAGEVSSGFRSTFYADPVAAGRPGQFASDDFVVHANNTRVTRLMSEGFVASGRLAATASQLTWQIYRDAGGRPAGNPQTSPQLAVWSHSAAPTAPGVSIDDGNLALDLAAAGEDVLLAPGRYWLVVYARTAYANRWVWYGSNSGDNVFGSISPGNDGTGTWQAGTGVAGLAWSLTADQPCGAAWIGAPTVALGTLAPGKSQDVQVQLNTSALAAGSHVGHVCVASNDPTQPKVAVGIQLTVTP